MGSVMWYLFWIVCASIGVAFAVTVRFRRSRYWQLGSKIPGPSGYPLMRDILYFGTRYKNALTNTKNHVETYGQVSKIWLGHHLLVSLTDPEDIKIVLSSQEALGKNFFYKALRLVWGCGLITSGTKKWKYHRKLLNPSFSLKNLEEYVAVFNKTSNSLLDIMSKRAEGTPVDLRHNIALCALSMVIQTILGTKMDPQSSTNLELANNLYDMKHLVRDIILNPIYWIDEVTKISPVYKKLMKIYRMLTNFASHTVLQKSQHVEENCSSGTDVSSEDRKSEKKGLCFIDHVLALLSTQVNLMTMDELTEHTLTVVIAAMGTSVFALCIVLKMLGLHADVQNRVLEEQKDIFGDDWGRPVTPGDLRRMVYLEQVMKETLRLFPIIPLIVRSNSHELPLTTHNLPAGSSIAIPIYLLHRDPRNFVDPLRFDPDRFNPETARGHHPFSFIPFSAGRRNCIGYMYAAMQVKTILSTVLRKYEFLPCGSREAMESWDFQITILLKNGYDVRFVPRKL